MKVYGIKNCDTVKKARAWLDDHGIEYEFVDFKKTPPSAAEISRWVDALGVEKVLNRRGTTWRKLSESERASANSESGAIAMLIRQPSAIKRPIIESGLSVFVGFDVMEYQVKIVLAGTSK